jgi:hypothetical protein
VVAAAAELFAAEGYARTTLAKALIGAASADPELDRYLTDKLASVRLQIQRVLEVYRDRGWLRQDVSFDELVETTAVVCRVETYLQMTHRDGWTAAAYRTWLRRMLDEAIFVRTQAN